LSFIASRSVSNRCEYGFETQLQISKNRVFVAQGG
jgi:hypothetical protein